MLWYGMLDREKGRGMERERERENRAEVPHLVPAMFCFEKISPSGSMLGNSHFIHTTKERRKIFNFSFISRVV